MRYYALKREDRGEEGCWFVRLADQDVPVFGPLSQAKLYKSPETFDRTISRIYQKCRRKSWQRPRLKVVAFELVEVEP